MTRQPASRRIKQERFGISQYRLVTPSGAIWHVYEAVYRRWEKGPWVAGDKPAPPRSHVWHLFDPDKNYVGSFQRLKQANEHVAKAVESSKDKP